MPRSFALGNRFERIIDLLVKNGRYNNASEVVRDGLRMVEDRERQRKKAAGDLRVLVEESDREGGELPAEEVRRRLLKRYDTAPKARRR
jgi:antitoxin ParD1/3/4